MLGSFLAIFSGLGLGYIFERGDFCFHSTWRGIVRRPQQLDLLRAYLFTLVLAIPLVQGLIALGWIDPWIPPFAWPANIVGGLVFGIGMVVASTCITGLFYKLGHGMLGVIVAIVFWAAGDMLTYVGPLRPLREALNQTSLSPGGQSATLLNSFGPGGWVLLAAFFIGAAVYLIRSPLKERGKLWNWVVLGGVTAVFMSLAWLLARAGGQNYTFGTSGVPTELLRRLQGDSTGSLWIPLALISLIPGALIAARHAGTLWVRGETGRRYAELAAGGLLMGVGAAIAGGCNLGHSLVGVPLLSLGSIATTMAMAAGVFLAHGVTRLLVTADSPEPVAA